MIPIFQILQTVKQIKSNPSMMSQFLLQQGRITQQQYNDIQQLGIGNNPEAIGQYLMNQGVMNPRQVDQVRQEMAMPIQQSMVQD